MKTAYLYVRVSTDEQKRKGYSLPEQEDRLLKYCKYNDIEVKGIYREDYSAKSFNRPEWKELFSEIKKKLTGEDKNILFIKWDRFSRNVECAYEMIGKLRKYKTTAMAIEQPIDFSVPESTVMLAVYLAVPEAENTRRAQNTSNGMRRAKLLGRYPNKAPMGFMNITLMDGRKAIVPKEPEAEIIKWVFQAAQNNHRISEIRKIAIEKGLICSRSYFFRILRNSLYCGLITIKLDAKEEQMIQGLHEPLISKSLFYQVQSIINTKRKITSNRDDLKEIFFLRGFLICPVCGRKLTGSFSKGKRKRYPYYHCHDGCRTRIDAVLLNNCYQNKLQKLVLSNSSIGLFKNILEDHNIRTRRANYLYAQQLLGRKIKEEKLTLSRGRKLLIAGILKIDDYNELKKESQDNTKNLKKEERDVTLKLRVIDKMNQNEDKTLVEVFQKFTDFDTSDKTHIVNLIPPVDIDYKTGNLSLNLNPAFSKILSAKTHRKNNKKNELH
ncbi:recombinase family protein [Chryseobacterium sp. RLHN22]|uniref:recombinase family protein n=1 Tax=Chryseobacterium sp. RLHN22 TaxID=3437885 RepID=UPI003D9BEEBC